MEANNNKRAEVIDPKSLFYGCNGRVVDQDDDYVVLQLPGAERAHTFLHSEVKLES